MNNEYRVLTGLMFSVSMKKKAAFKETYTTPKKLKRQILQNIGFEYFGSRFQLDIIVEVAIKD